MLRFDFGRRRNDEMARLHETRGRRAPATRWLRLPRRGGAAMGMGLLLAWALGVAPARAAEPVVEAGTEDSAESSGESTGKTPDGPSEGRPQAGIDPSDWDPDDPAQSAAETEEIIVTATKRSERLQRVPISIAALGGQEVLDAGITQFDQLQAFVPNLQIRPVTDSRSTSVRIRGIGSVGNNAGIDPSVGIFIDGVYQGRAGMSVGDLMDIERIEVLRGPQGTLYGKNTAAGAINILTRSPVYEYETFLEGVVGNYNDLRLRGSVNVPLVEDRLAVRFSGYKVSRNGFDQNRFDGQKVNDAKQYGVRGKIGWDVTDSLYLELSGDYAEQNTRAFVADIVDYRGNGPSLTDIPFGALATTSGVPLAKADPFDQIVGANVAPRNYVEIGGVALDTRSRLGDHDLRWLNAWRTYGTDSRFDGDFSRYDAVLAYQDVDLDQVSSELTLVSPSRERFNYQTGLFLFYMVMDTLDRNGWEQGLVDAAAFVGNPLFTTPTENVNINEHDTLSAAAYGEATLAVTDTIGLTGGLRVTYERKTREGLSLTNPPTVLDAAPILGPDLYRDEERDVTNVQGRIVLRYSPTDDAMVYTSFANGFKSGGFNQLRVSPTASSEFDDEQSLTWELGFRTQWLDRRLTLNATGYFTDYDDFQSQAFDGASITVRNAAQLYSYGFESDLSYRSELVEGLALGLQVGLNIAEYESFPGAEATVQSQYDQAKAVLPNVAPVITCAVLVDCSQDLSGRVLDNAPRWTVTTFGRYERPLPHWPVVWFLRADYSYTSEYYLSQDLDPNLLQSGYHRLNLRTGLRADDELWELTLWADNITNADYLVIGFDVPIVSGFAAVKAPPRRYGGTVRVRF
jgi:iron complex outermembrane receptor protein